MKPVVITGTDTGVGKTVFAAGLTAALGAQYWKPVQSGLEETTDSQIVAELSKCPVLPEAYRLRRPASPHLAAEDMGLEIDLGRLDLPQVDGPLVVEGAGGVMVPLNRKTFFIDLMSRWKAPVILVARTQLGTINHTALSLKALRAAGCPLLGVAFVGTAEPDVEQTITEMCAVRHLGRLNLLADLTHETLTHDFRNIDLDAIRAAL
ncbi:MAG: dethiobiotin synthase [Rhodobacterales bacterium]|nr:dethiobiotin synthase [Rhodobacterales bacterium]